MKEESKTLEHNASSAKHGKHHFCHSQGVEHLQSRKTHTTILFIQIPFSLIF